MTLDKFIHRLCASSVEPPVFLGVWVEPVTLPLKYGTAWFLVLPMLSDRCPVLSVCNVGALWPNGRMDQNETWHADSN